VSDQTFTVSQVLQRLQQAVVREYPSPIWVRGEVTGVRRTSRGAVFFRLADPEVSETALEVAARGRVMMEVDRILDDAGLGSLRDGIEARVKGTIGVDERGSRVRLSLLEVDPTFTAGRIALDRAGVIRRMEADGSLRANGSLPLPLVPLRIGLVTSRGSAAHADFIDQLRRSSFRFRVKTAHTAVQGEQAAAGLVDALRRLGAERLDMVAVIRGGGSKLDLGVFDTEEVARAIATCPVPVITGIGHDIDRAVSDEAAAVATKTPSAAGEWLVGRVMEFANRIAVARHTIRSEADAALQRQRQVLRHAAADVGASATTLRRRRDALENIRLDVAHSSRNLIERRRSELHTLGEWFEVVDVEQTLRRGFAIVTGAERGQVIRSVDGASPGDVLVLRFADGTVRVTVEDD
jgi:exodeoxyribonuclease VII large subunit